MIDAYSTFIQLENGRKPLGKNVASLPVIQTTRNSQVKQQTDQLMISWVCRTSHDINVPVCPWMKHKQTTYCAEEMDRLSSVLDSSLYPSSSMAAAAACLSSRQKGERRLA